MKKLDIQSDIRKAATLPAWFYRDSQAFETVKEKIFARSWHYVADATVVEAPTVQYPFTLLPGVMDEPLLLTRDGKERLHCLSNVCTHRGKIIVEEPGKGRLLRCGYHGRCFGLDGAFRSMPSFDAVENFPAPEDDLTALSVKEWLGMIFISLEPEVAFEEMIRPIEERLGWMPFDTLQFSEEGTQDYYVDANWALYCDNYLEGFHIPFVHPALNQAITSGSYGYELFPYCSLQLGLAEEGEPCHDIPEGWPDYGKRIYAYYYFVFPNLMLNFYPWGLSLNVVEPLSHNKTRVRFRTYYFAGAPANRQVNRIDQTELEDEEVVESVQLGLQSRFYKKGRFSPKEEPAVHHFHRLVADYFNRD